jgi:O-antigen/teichoic acid export membrane protein
LLQVMVTVWLIKRLQVPGAAAALVVGSLGVVAVRAYFYAREMREA